MHFNSIVPPNLRSRTEQSILIPLCSHYKPIISHFTGQLATARRQAITPSYMASQCSYRCWLATCINHGLLARARCYLTSWDSQVDVTRVVYW